MKRSFDADVPDGDPELTGGSVAFVGLVFLLLAYFVVTRGWVPVLDSANLAFHEAGHPLVGLFSARLMVYGGTLFQLAFPFGVAWHFRRRGQAVGQALGWLWLGESLHNVARYMADARAQDLPLVGGGDHDWAEIFMRWHVLHFDTRIANLTHALAWGLMLWALVRLWRQWQRQHA